MTYAIDILTQAVLSAGVVLAAHLFGATKRIKFAGVEDATVLLARLFPGKSSSDVILSDDGAAALCRFDDGSLSVIFAHGTHWCERPLEKALIQKVEKAAESGVVLRLNDSAAPEVKFTLTDEEVRNRFRHCVVGLMEGEADGRH